MLSVAPFVPGGRQIVLLDFSTFPLGPLLAPPANRCVAGSACRLVGDLEIVMKDGVRMLRASSRSSFVVALPEMLPSDFTLEFDLVPKECCMPEDLGFEGRADITQDAYSANVLWHRDYLHVVGGIANESYDRPMPPALRAALPGALTNIAVSLQGQTLRVFTNGQPIHSLERSFARGQVLRVFLGGQNSTDRAVYLARLRIAATGGAVVAAATAPVTPVAALPVATPTATATPIQPPPSVGTPPNAIMAGDPGVLRLTLCAQRRTGGPAPTVLTTMGPTPVGATIRWKQVPNAVYVVERAPASGTPWILIGSSCGGPMPLTEFSDQVAVTDRTGGLGVTTSGIYRVTAILPDGQTGWNTVKWYVPCLYGPKPVATVTGSTVALSWSTNLTTCGTAGSGGSPDYYLVTTSYGTSTEVTGTSLSIHGVPLGTHTFSVEAHWRPDGRSTKSSTTAVVKY
jgi:hypothetical protein